MKNFLNNKKGLTLIELLAVIAIIAILFVLLIPQISSSIEKARKTGVQTDFHSYQIGTESYLRQTNGAGMTTAGLDSFLDKTLRAGAYTTSGQVHTGDSLEKDPWGNAYTVVVDGTNKMISVKSKGPNGAAEAAGATTTDDIAMHTYAFDGTVFTCTTGFDSNNAGTELFASVINDTTKKCGDVPTP